MKYFVKISFTLIFCISSLSAQWEYWEANELPDTTGTPWVFDAEAGVVTFSSIIDDPEIEGNKLLRFASTASPRDEVFRYLWNAEVETGATLVIRMKAIGDGNYDRDWDIYIQNGVYRERCIAENSNIIKFNKSGQQISDFGKDLSEWHIYRITLIEDVLDLFIDEDPLGYLTANGPGDADGGNYFQFGDNGKETYGTIYDWIAWDVSGAYPPGEGDPLPSELTGLPAAIRQISSVMPEQFELGQNYPNPFNPSTEINFKVQKITNVEISIYNLNGQLVCNLVNEEKNIGIYTVTWNGLDSNGKAVPSGVYFYTMKADNYHTSKKMTLIR